MSDTSPIAFTAAVDRVRDDGSLDAEADAVVALLSLRDMTDSTLTKPPRDLRFEHLDDAVLGTDVLRPRFSWQLPEGAKHQLAYEIAVGDWSTGVVTGSDRILVRYTGPEPAARERHEWRVRVWTDLGESSWSDPAFWEMGLLQRSDWSASWIRPNEGDVPPPGHRPVYALHSRIVLTAPVVSARAYVTAHGIYELFVNAQRVGDQELTPGFTAYRSNLQVQTYDLSAMLREGPNDLGALLSDGWYRGLFGYSRNFDNFGTRTALLAQVEVTLANGDIAVFGTNLDWGSTISDSPAADLLDGQRVEQYVGGFDWNRDDWEPVLAPSDPLCEDWSRLRSTPAPPVRRIRTITPSSVTRLNADRLIVDLGENTNGWLQLDPLDAADGYRAHPCRGPRCERRRHDRSSPPRDRSQHVQCVQPDRLCPHRRRTDVRAPPHHTRFPVRRRRRGPSRHRRLGLFAAWRCVPTCDTPAPSDAVTRASTACMMQRCEAGAPTPATYRPTARSASVPHGPVTSRYSRRQQPSLTTSPVSPTSGSATWPSTNNPTVWCATTFPARRPHVNDVEGSSGWGDAAVTVPWQMWVSYRDRDLLARQYPSAVAWLQFAENAARNGRAPERIAANPVAPAHEQYLWDTGFHWGEWLEPGVPIDLTTEQAIVATAYLANSARVLARTAEVLGKVDDSQRWAKLASNVAMAWATEFVRPDGRLTRDTQASYVRALTLRAHP